MIATPYLLYLGHSNDEIGIKTSRGLAVFRPDICVGEFRHDDCGLTLGLPRLDFAAAWDAGARTLVLVDGRHGPKDVDREMMKMLDEAAVGYRIVLTKSDKIKASALAETHDKVAAEAKKHPAAYPEIHLTSAEKGQGIAALRAAIVADALTP